MTTAPRTSLLEAALVAVLMHAVTMVCGCGKSEKRQQAQPAIDSKPATPKKQRTKQKNLKPWRADQRLAGKFHPKYPDDVQVLVHAGGPRLTSLRPELVWVRLTSPFHKVYRGTLLNHPKQLPGLKAGDSILVLPTTKANRPIMVTSKYLRERGDWKIAPCDKCGMPELFDAPSVLYAKVFPGPRVGEKVVSFTSHCPVCGGVQVVSARSSKQRKR